MRRQRGRQRHAPRFSLLCIAPSCLVCTQLALAKAFCAEATDRVEHNLAHMRGRGNAIDRAYTQAAQAVFGRVAYPATHPLGL